MNSVKLNFLENGIKFYTTEVNFGKKQKTIYHWFKELEKHGLVKRLQFTYNGPTYTYLRPYSHSRKW